MCCAVCAVLWCYDYTSVNRQCKSINAYYYMHCMVPLHILLHAAGGARRPRGAAGAQRPAYMQLARP